MSSIVPSVLKFCFEKIVIWRKKIKFQIKEKELVTQKQKS